MRRYQAALARGGERRWYVVERDCLEPLLVKEVQRSERCPTNARRLLKHRLKNRLQLAGRTADDSENFRRCCLLFQGVRQITRLGLYFLKQTRVLDRDH